MRVHEGAVFAETEAWRLRGAPRARSPRALTLPIHGPPPMSDDDDDDDDAGRPTKWRHLDDVSTAMARPAALSAPPAVDAAASPARLAGALSLGSDSLSGDEGGPLVVSPKRREQQRRRATLHAAAFDKLRHIEPPRPSAEAPAGGAAAASASAVDASGKPVSAQPTPAKKKRGGLLDRLVKTVRGKVSKKKIRFQLDDFDLDLTYITPRIIAMGFPSEGTETFFRNPLPEVQRFFEERHAGRYKLRCECPVRTNSRPIAED